jgi:hypothetical protein
MRNLKHSSHTHLPYLFLTGVTETTQTNKVLTLDTEWFVELFMAVFGMLIVFNMSILVDPRFNVCTVFDISDHGVAGWSPVRFTDMCLFSVCIACIVLYWYTPWYVLVLRWKEFYRVQKSLRSQNCESKYVTVLDSRKRMYNVENVHHDELIYGENDLASAQGNRNCPDISAPVQV